MSGKPKLTEAEELRQLTREAHEAIKDMRLAMREMRAAQAEHIDFLDKSLQLAASAGIEQISNVGQQTLSFIQGQIDHLMAHISALVGAEDREQLVNEIVSESARSLASQLMLGLDADGSPAIVPHSHHPRGEIFVTTDPALAPPGSIIIDGR